MSLVTIDVCCVLFAIAVGVNMAEYCSCHALQACLDSHWTGQSQAEM